MIITLIQTAPVWGNPAASRSAAEALLERADAGTDLIVFPEMFSTGFISEPEGVAEPGGGDTLPWMRRVAAERDCAVAGSVAVGDGGRFVNRFFFVFPDGTVRHYDKRHLFSYGSEHLHFTAGEERVVVSWRGVRILLQVCYDLRFPVFARNRAVDGEADYDLILYVASWPTARIGAWDILLRARAIENQCYVAGVNRVGNDPLNRYCGHSAAIGPTGDVLGPCREGEEDVVNAVLDMEALKAFRSRFPVLKDADPFSAGR